MIEVKTIDYSKPEAELRNIIQARVMGVVAGIKAIDTLKSDGVRATAMLVGGLSQLDKADEATGMQVMTLLAKTAKAAYSDGTEFPVLADDAVTALEQTKTPPLAVFFEQVFTELELDAVQKQSQGADDLRLACGSLLPLFLGIFHLVDEIYSFDLFNFNDVGTSRDAVVSEAALTRLLKAGQGLLNVSGTVLETEPCD